MSYIITAIGVIAVFGILFWMDRYYADRDDGDEDGGSPE